MLSSELRSVELEIRLNGSARKPPILPGAWIFQVLYANLQPFWESAFSGSARKPPTLPGAWIFMFCTQTSDPSRSLDFQVLHANLRPFLESGFSGSARKPSTLYLVLWFSGSALIPITLPGAWIFRLCTQTSNSTWSLNFQVLHANIQPYLESWFSGSARKPPTYLETGFSGSVRKPSTLHGAYIFRFCTQTSNPTWSLDFQVFRKNRIFGFRTL